MSQPSAAYVMTSRSIQPPFKEPRTIWRTNDNLLRIQFLNEQVLETWQYPT